MRRERCERGIGAVLGGAPGSDTQEPETGGPVAAEKGQGAGADVDDHGGYLWWAGWGAWTAVGGVVECDWERKGAA